MKTKLSFILFFVCVYANVHSQTIITSQEAKNHIGDSVTVRGTVSEIFTSEKGNVFISFDNKYPEETFSVVIFKRNNLDISTIKVGSVLTVCGRIHSFNNKPEMILKAQEQIMKVE